MKLFIGQKMAIKASKDIIEIKPFEYRCRWCDANVPEGDEYGACEECIKKNTRKIY